MSAPPLTWRAKMLIEQYDDKTIQCPRLGGEVDFRFCRCENNMLPCEWIVGCWQMRMDIDNFLEEHYSKEEQNRIFAIPGPKIESLLDLIEKAKKVKEENDAVGKH
jgi:hypothetical protein